MRREDRKRHQEEQLRKTCPPRPFPPPLFFFFFSFPSSTPRSWPQPKRTFEGCCERSRDRTNRSTSDTSACSLLANTAFSSFSSSSSFTRARLPARRKERVLSSMASAEGLAIDGAPKRDHPGSHVTDRDCRLRPGHLRQRCPPLPRRRSLLFPWGRRTLRGPPPPRLLCCPSSVPVGRRKVHAPNHGCDEGLRTAQLRRSSARAAATSGAVAPSSASRSQWNHGRDQHKSHPLGFETSRSHKQGNACLGRLWWLWWLWSGPCVHGKYLSMNHDDATNSGGRTPGSKLLAGVTATPFPALCLCTGPYQHTLSKLHESCSTAQQEHRPPGAYCNCEISMVRQTGKSDFWI